MNIKKATKVTPSKIYIDDLDQPQYTEQQQFIVDLGKKMTCDFDAEKVMEQARQKTGLKDFGSDDFIERLEIQIDAVHADPYASAIGRTSNYNDLVLYACNRLLLTRLWQQEPSSYQQDIKRPVIIAGLPRSGTTHLVNLMAADKRFRSLPLWESRQPLGAIYQTPSTLKSAANDHTKDKRYIKCHKEWEQSSAQLPLMEFMHPMHPDHIHEEIDLQNADFSSYILEWVAYVPKWRDYYLGHDQTPHYEFMKKVLSTLQWYRAGERWILKSPQHMEQLKALHHNFSDATLVFTHRDPVAVIASIATMSAYSARLRCQKIDLHAIITYWIERVDTILRACIHDRDVWPQEQTIHIVYNDFMQDELGTLERIYETADIGYDAKTKEEHHQYIEKHSGTQRQRIGYNLKKHFNIEVSALQQRFEYYYKAFNVPMDYSD